jgi:hypothetical protein
MRIVTTEVFAAYHLRCPSYNAVNQLGMSSDSRYSKIHLYLLCVHDSLLLFTNHGYGVLYRCVHTSLSTNCPNP